LPLCTSGDQLACIIVYGTFRNTNPPSANSSFGRHGIFTRGACTNPAALAHGGDQLHAYLNSSTTGRSAIASWTTAQPLLVTTFAKVPDLLTARCVSTATHSYLEITVHGNPDDPRTDDIGGDVISEGQRNSDWGLHSVDISIAMEDLLTLVARQSKQFAGPRPSLMPLADSVASFRGTARRHPSGLPDNEFSAAEAIDVAATISIDPNDIGATGYVYVVVEYDGSLFQKTTQSFIPFDGDLDTLVSFSPPHILQAEESFGIVGQLTGLPGEFRVYTAYSTASRELKYSQDPLFFRVGN
jgi:hypothetical protein